MEIAMALLLAVAALGRAFGASDGRWVRRFGGTHVDTGMTPLQERKAEKNALLNTDLSNLIAYAAAAVAAIMAVFQLL